MTRRRDTAAPAANSRVEILTGQHQVIVEAAEPMDAVINAAMTLWRDTCPADAMGGPVGFTTSAIISEPYEQPLMAPEISLPHQLTQQENPDDNI